MFKFKQRFVSLLSTFTVIRLKVKITQATQEIFPVDRMPAKAKFSCNKFVSISFRMKDRTSTIAHDTDISHSARNCSTNTKSHTVNNDLR